MKSTKNDDKFFDIALEQIEYSLFKYKGEALIKYYSLIHTAAIFAKENIELTKEQREWIEDTASEKCKIKFKKTFQTTSIIDNFVENPNADNRLYYFRFSFKNKKYYKIGITSQSLEARYGNEYSKIEKILYNKRIDGAIKIERDIKEKFKDDIFPLAYLNNGGHTETFDRDILELDYI